MGADWHSQPTADATPAEVRFQLAVRWLGSETAHRLYRDSEGKIVDAESITVEDGRDSRCPCSSLPNW